jgi:UDP-N-acetylglucosamine--N-acetylmuramyl-(pentapeptide) pyrophosphoryl-undecaprenol N-acetylglucosamine transferase
MKPKLDRKIVVTGGGSGGHVSAATAFIDGLREIFDIDMKNILYIGGDLAMVGEKDSKSIEERRLENTDIPFKKIRAGKLQRQWHISTIPLLLRTFLGIWDANKLVKEFKPDLIFFTGGFVTVPVAFAAWRMKIPVYLHEQTAAVGLSNRIVSRMANKIYTTFPNSHKYFPEKKIVQVGNAVRPAIFQKNGRGAVVEAVKGMLDLKDNLPILYISGGGQGSHILNITIRQMLPYLLQEFQVVLQTGDNQILKDYDVLERDWKKLPQNLQSRFFPTKFVNDDEIGYLFENMDFFIGRAGANTVYEMGVIQKPSIFIPIPWVTNNEQFKNAQILEELGLAKILPEGELTAEKLFMEIKKLRGNWPAMRSELKREELEATFRTDAVGEIIKDMFKN